MYEIILTLRPDFREEPLGRYAAAEQAREIARGYAAAHHDKVVRAWVRKAHNKTAPKTTDRK